MKFNETWQEARSQRPLPSLCFSGRLEKQDGLPGLWFAETFSTSPLKPLKGIQWNLTGSKILTSSTKFVFFGPIGKTRWPPWPLIGWDIFDFSSETAEWNSTKLYRKQDLNFLYQVCVFGPIGKTRWPPWPLIGWDIFDFSAERNSMKLDRKQDLNVLYQVCVFRADRKNKMVALASDWLRHFRLLLWNCWTEFNEIWQEARSQRLLSSLCFSGRSVNKNVRLGWFLKKVADCTQVHDMWPFRPLVFLFFVSVSISYVAVFVWLGEYVGAWKYTRSPFQDDIWCDKDYSFYLISFQGQPILLYMYYVNLWRGETVLILGYNFNRSRSTIAPCINLCGCDIYRPQFLHDHFRLLISCLEWVEGTHYTCNHFGSW